MTSARPQRQDPPGSDYLRWKDWGTDRSFGKLKRHYEAYYSAEIRRTRLDNIDRVLEIGFGDGTFFTYAKKRGWRITGTEINDVLIDVALRAGFDAVPASRLPDLADNHFDLILAFHVLEHVAQDELGSFLRLLRAKLRDGGVLLAKFPNGDSPLGLADQNGDVTHLTVLGRGKIEYFAQNAGFEVVYLGAEAQPILCGSLKHALHRIVLIPVAAVMELFVKLLFFPKSRITYFANSLVAALRKPTLG